MSETTLNDFVREGGAFEATQGGVLVMKGAKPSKMAELDEEKRELTVVVSTDSVDRYGDVLNPKGAKLKNYRRNPTVLYGHNSHSALPIGRSQKTITQDGAVVARPRFHKETELAREVWALVKIGVLNAWSVGFIPLKWEWIKDKDGRNTGGWNIEEWEMLEFSSVPVPANQDALTLALKSMRISAPILTKSLEPFGFKAPDLVRVPAKEEPDNTTTEEGQDMTLKELLAKDAVAAAEYKAAIETAVAVAKKEAKDAAKKELDELVKAVSPVLASDAYDAVFKKQAVKTLSGEMAKEVFLALVTQEDMTAERAKSADAKAESKASVDGVPGQLGSDGGNKGVVSSEADADALVKDLSNDQ